jgi:hypothetical protein
MVTLRSDNNAAELPQSAKLFKNSTDRAGVYINPDLTPAEAQAAYVKRLHLRRMRSRTTYLRAAVIEAGSRGLAAANGLLMLPVLRRIPPLTSQTIDDLLLQQLLLQCCQLIAILV